MQEKKETRKRLTGRISTVKKEEKQKKEDTFGKVGNGKYPNALMKKREKMMKKWSGEQ